VFFFLGLVVAVTVVLDLHHREAELAVAAAVAALTADIAAHGGIL
jgi:hypothetical protein